MSVYDFKSFRNLMKSDPKRALHISFAADMQAGKAFGADLYKCSKFNWAGMKADPVYVEVLTRLKSFWNKAMEGLEVRRFSREGQGLVVVNQR